MKLCLLILLASVVVIANSQVTSISSYTKDYALYATMHFGDNRQPIDMFVDTGSDLIYALCDGDGGLNTGHGGFYRQQIWPYHGLFNRRTDHRRYGKCRVEGDIVRDQISASPNGKKTSTLFICTTFNSCPIDFLLALGRNFTSMVGQYSFSWFSHCVSMDWIGNRKPSELLFGKAALPVRATGLNMLPDNEFYKVAIEGIGFGGKNLGSGFSMILDTGYTVSVFPRPLYDRIWKEIDRKVEWSNNPEVDPKDKKRCFDERYLEELEPLNIRFPSRQQQTPMSIDPAYYTWQEYPGLACLALKGTSSEEDEPILGLVNMQNHNVTYDLVNSKVYISRANC